MSIDLMPGFGAFTQSTLLDGSEADGTNILPNPAAAMTSNWTTEATTFTNATTTAPDGATTASSLEDGTGDVRHILYQQITNGISSATRMTLSIYAKQNTLRYLQLLPSNSAGTVKAYVYADLQTGTITDSGVISTATLHSSSIQAAVNGFYKITMDVSLTVNEMYVQFSTSNVSTYGAPLEFDSPKYAGTTQSLYLWRPKVVEG